LRPTRILTRWFDPARLTTMRDLRCRGAAKRRVCLPFARRLSAPLRLRTTETRLLVNRMISPEIRCLASAKLTVTFGAGAKRCVRELLRAAALDGATAATTAATTTTRCAMWRGKVTARSIGAPLAILELRHRSAAIDLTRRGVIWRWDGTAEPRARTA
jgi:hypothetical protein